MEYNIKNKSLPELLSLRQIGIYNAHHKLKEFFAYEFWIYLHTGTNGRMISCPICLDREYLYH